MSDDINRQIFREEAYELLAELETTLLELEGRSDDMDIVNRVFRALHTIKGSGSMFGFDDIAGFTHEVESVFDMVRNGDLKISRGLLDQAFLVRDHIQRMLDEGGGDEVDPQEAGAILEALRGISSGEAEVDNTVVPPRESALDGPGEADGDVAKSEDSATLPAAAAAAAATEKSREEGAEPITPEEEPNADTLETRRWQVRISPRPDDSGEQFHIEPLLEELAKLGPCEVRADESGVPLLKDLIPGHIYVAWDVVLETVHGAEDVKDVFFFSDAPLDVQVSPAPAVRPQLAAPPAETLTDEGWELLDDVESSADQESVLESESPVTGSGVQSTAVSENSASDVEHPAPSAPIAPPSAASSPEAVPAASAMKTDSGPKLAAKPTPPAAKAKPTAEDRPAPRAPDAGRQQDAVTSIRVAAEKLDSLVDLVGELVIVQAQISQLSLEREDAILKRLAEDLERLSDELRDSALSVRMLPIGTSFSKFRRLVRDLSGELGKEIQLTTAGADTELDKTVIERLADPLVHLLRNSIDHGVEFPEDRAAAGKPKTATIHLAAEHAGGEVLIRILDDGRGIDPDVIREKALERGIIAPDAELSRSDILNLIFEPGFSTAKQVTSVSGRGVGMDVVKRAIDALRGRIVINSTLGKGTEITIKLPLTLAIIDGLQVLVGDEHYVVPLTVVEECVELRAKDEQDSDGRILYLRGEIVPYVQLRECFDIEADRPEIEQVVIVGLEGRRVGIVVDKVIGEHQTVIKSLGKIYKDVDGISGATIKGDGSIALILDVPGLMRRVIAESA